MTHKSSYCSDFAWKLDEMFGKFEQKLKCVIISLYQNNMLASSQVGDMTFPSVACELILWASNGIVFLEVICI